MPSALNSDSIDAMNRGEFKSLRHILVVVLLLMAANAYSQTTSEPQDLPSQPAQPKRIIPIGNLDILGTYSDSNKGSGLWGYDISGSFSPVVRLNDTQYLIPLYNGAYKRMRQYVTQEEGGRLYNTWQLHNGSLALRTQLTDELTNRITAFGSWNFVKETRDESFGEGLYDYRDLGGSCDMRYTILTLDEKRNIYYRGGIEYFRRKYPNFQSLISLAAVTAPEKNEKEFDAIKFSTGLEEKNPAGISWELKPSVLLKYFVDKKLIHEDGVLDPSKKRRDYVFEIDLNGAYPFGEGRWEIALDNSIDYNHSNIGFYDTRDTALISDDVFTNNYYTYLSMMAYPYLTYYHALSRDKKISIRAGYSFLRRDYSGRRAQEADGTYTNVKQKDKEHAFHITTFYPITKSMAWVTTFDYTIEKSNQKYEKYYRYEYAVYQVQSGISIRF